MAPRAVTPAHLPARPKSRLETDAARMRDKIEITFLGTRGEINVSSRRHRRHSALLIARRGSRIMLDCGADWLGRLRLIAPTAIILTHAHLDHAGGLADGAPCPVYATSETLRLLREFPIRNRRRVPPDSRRDRVQGISRSAFSSGADRRLSSVLKRRDLLLSAGRCRSSQSCERSTRRRRLCRRRRNADPPNCPH